MHRVRGRNAEKLLSFCHLTKQRLINELADGVNERHSWHDAASPDYRPKFLQITEKAYSTANTIGKPDRLADNLTPLGRAYYAASTLNCVPTSLSQPRGLALGAQAGEARLREIVTRAGFTRYRRPIDAPFNLVIEARP
jgi:hypothetical protein